MAVEGKKCNGFLKLGDSSGEGLITYKRRKRGRSSLDAGQVSNMPLHKGKNRDIGWEHGVIVDGNRFHWKCNWCGLVRYGGGVSRLKQHIAGTCHVQKCKKVPEDVAKNMMNHLIAKQKDRRTKIAARNGVDKMKSKFHHEDDLVGKDNVKIDLEMKGKNASQPSKRATKQYGVASQRSRAATQRSRTTTQQFNIGMVKQDMKEAHDADLYSSTYEKDDHARIDSHWRQVLERFLQLPDVSEGSGIQSCIRDALIYGPGFTREFPIVDSPMDITQPKDRPEGHNELKSQSRILNGSTSDVSKTGTSDVNANTIKCQNVFLDILRSEKFALLCDLLCVTSQDNKVERFFDFSLINSKMKNGDYEKLPGSFDQDIQQVWDKFQKIGREMVLLAAGLSNVSRVSYQKQVGQDLVNGASEHKPEETCRVVGEQKNSMESIQLTSCESDRSTKPDQTEASGLYKVCICKKCGLNVNGERSLICDGCEAMYHFSCTEPAVEEIPSRSWHCSACRTNKRESSEFASAHIQPDSLHQDCGLYKVSICKECGIDVNGERSVICDGCEAMYHFSCTELAVEENPSRRWDWYCSACHTNNRESSQPPHIQRDKVCICKDCGIEVNGEVSVICDRCEATYHFSCTEPPVEENPSRSWHCSACGTNNRESSEPAHIQPDKVCICKECGIDVNGDASIICDGCEAMYHFSCTELAVEENPSRRWDWYCSACHTNNRESSQPPHIQRDKVCICKDCGIEVNGEVSVICDRCEATYHFSCTEPPVEENPSRSWHCSACRTNNRESSEPAHIQPDKVCICKECGIEVNGEVSVICDRCEAAYHFSCTEPAVEENPSRSWHCSACHTNNRESSEPASAHIQPDSLHQDCAVCDRLEFSETQEENDSGSRTVVADDSRESSVSSMESDESPEMSRTAISRLCKLCGTCEDEDKRFLICGHAHCPYKFYHIRCLKTSQIASAQQQNKPCWYCPSCLCRACLCDKDDDKIVLCDGCDEAYHTYCMKPYHTSIPQGHWYCVPCNVTRAREGMKRYEQSVLQRHRKNDVRQASEANRSMDLLLSAAEKLSSEERLVAGKQDK